MLPLLLLLTISLTGCSGMRPSQMETERFLIDLQDSDPTIRQAAVDKAGPMGADAVEPVAALIAGGDRGVTASARDALARIVEHAADPETLASERRAVALELTTLLRESDSDPVRIAVLQTIPLIADRRDVSSIAALLGHPTLREHALASLERIPGKRVDRALLAEYHAASSDFKPALAAALQRRGVELTTP